MKSIYYRTPYQQILVHEIKEPFRKAMNVLLNPRSSPLGKARAVRSLWKLIPVINSLPEPAVKNTRQESSHILIGIRDRFFKRLKVSDLVRKILLAIVNGVIIVNDTDFYRPFISWWVIELRKSDWPPLGPLQPDPHFFDNEKNAGGKTQ